VGALGDQPVGAPSSVRLLKFVAWASRGSLAGRDLAGPSLQEFIGSVGAAPAPPEIMVSEAVSSPDQF
jgi:hypothetical protein